jgi:murein DD-endopeptidase MepM/ murein hydrolase activator NlpD
MKRMRAWRAAQKATAGPHVQWIRTALGILRHDLTLVSLFVALVVLGAGVFGVSTKGQRPAAHAHDAGDVAALLAASSSDTAEPPGDAAFAPSGSETPFEPEIATDSGALSSTDAVPPAPSHAVFEGELVRGETLSQALREDGVSPQIVHAITREMGKLFNFRRARPGHDYRLELDPDGEVVEFRYATSPIETYFVTKSDGSLEARREEPPTRTEVARIAGVVTSSLHDAMSKLGESAQLAADLADIFAWEIDFTRSVHYGDEFRVLYERRYRSAADGREFYVGPGRILAARYSGGDGDHVAVYFESEDGRGGYYREDGSSVERNFLMAPVRHSKITSAFSNARLHPILRIWRPHHGIDYAAPRGTPIWAVADGTVIYRGRAGGFGNLIKIRHHDGYISYYGHMQSFARGIAEGQRVHQKQVIGTVGSTGLSTGPHVCFRMSKDGKFVDPARIQLPGGPPLSTALRKAFAGERDLLLARLDSAAPLVETDSAL